MIRRYDRPSYIAFIALFILTLCSQTGFARRLKIYQYPKTIAAGQLALIVFENPQPDVTKAVSKCSAEKLIAWVKSDIPIIRVEQGGKQIWTSLGSYQTAGDSCIATFMVPVMLSPGAATMYIVNDHDASIPYNFTVNPKMEASLTGIFASAITPLTPFRVLGTGFLPIQLMDKAYAIKDLQINLNYNKLSKADQYIQLNRRITPDWDRVPDGDFLWIEQNGKKWQCFVEQCGIERGGLALDFIAPPDITAGTATLTLVLRQQGKEVARTAPLTVSVQ